jgi:hypothetical protein
MNQVVPLFAPGIQWTGRIWLNLQYGDEASTFVLRIKMGLC